MSQLITPQQSTAARSLLGLTRKAASEKGAFAFSTLRRFEQGIGPKLQPQTIKGIKSGFESLGIEFIAGGVKLKTQEQ